MLRRPGGYSEEATPDPIPNSAVKLLSANGTSSQDAGESVAARSSKHMNANGHTKDTKPYSCMGRAMASYAIFKVTRGGAAR